MELRCLAVLSVASLVACNASEPSPCFAPRAYSYAGTVRQIGVAPESPLATVALPDGRAAMLTFNTELVSSAWVVEPADGSVTKIGEWSELVDVMVALRDGRLLVVGGSMCSYSLLDPAAPGSVTPRSCDAEHFNPELAWPVDDGRVVLFGNDWGPDGNTYGGAAYMLTLADGAMRRLGAKTEDGFSDRLAEPMELCDGRLMFPVTEFFGGDFTSAAMSMHTFDPASESLTSVAAPFTGQRAVQIDAETALVLTVEDGFGGAVTVYALDLETGAAAVTTTPTLPWKGFLQPLVGLADGSALLCAEDGAIHRYDPATRTFAATEAAFASGPQTMVRLTTGPVLAVASEGLEIALYE